MTTAKYSFGAEGNRHVLLAAADALAETQQQFFESSNLDYSPEYFNKIPALRQPLAVVAWGGFEIIATLIVFISSCFAKKIFDEIYERTLKRPIAAQLDIFFEKISATEGMLIEYQDIIYLEDINLAVVISAIADKNNTKAIEEQVLQAHRIAYGYIERHGRKAPIHYHKIINGQATLEPQLFDNIKEIKKSNVAKVKSKLIALKK